MTAAMRYHLLDVFTDEMFGGNQLAVFPDAAAIPEALMPKIARELALSETAFVLPPAGRGVHCRLRIFTPGAELPFAGHPTIGTAILLTLLDSVPASEGDVRFTIGLAAGSVDVRVRPPAAGRPAFAQLTAPRAPELRDSPVSPEVIARMLGLSVGDIVAARGNGPAAASCGTPFLCIPLASRDALARARLQLPVWEQHVAHAWAPSLYLYCFEPERAGSDIRARMFAPAHGIGEDPATGGAACALAGLLAQRAGIAGTRRWRIEQGFEMGRPSIVDIEADVENGVVQRARVGGSAVSVGDGTLHL